ncbi:unnamed protein product [Pleuronectes platessa]|uniref:Uncharacterized protein n=1 Tax=Pleuronectes platessa TaxID=8262 RepID=A0A9N7V729_PLEPL|nr:unnamed protein product [Pleuronectes platessa]
MRRAGCTSPPSIMMCGPQPPRGQSEAYPPLSSVLSLPAQREDRVRDGASSPPLLEETSSVPVQIDLNHPQQSFLRAIDSIDQEEPSTYRPRSALNTPSSPNELIINKGWLCKHHSTDSMMDRTALDANQYNAKRFSGPLKGPWVSFTLHDQACTGAPHPAN